MALLYVPTANQKDSKPTPPPPQTNTAGKQEIKRPAPQPAIGSSQIMLPLNIAGNAVNTAAPNLTTVTPQPVIVNNQVLLILKLCFQIMCNKNEYQFNVDLFFVFSGLYCHFSTISKQH